MSTARTSTLAHLRGSIERIETSGDAHAPNKAALGHAGADATLQGGLAMAAVHEVFGRPPECGGDRLHRWPRRAADAAPAAGLGAAGFFRTGIRCAVDERALRTRPRSAPAGDGACRGRRCRAAHRRRRAGLRCARRRGAGSLGRGAAARSRRQPQTHLGGASLRRHRLAAAGGGHAATVDRGNKMDRARGAFAAGITLYACGAWARMGRADVRRAARS